MSDGDIVLHWLARASARLGWSRRIRELGRLACALIALALFVEILAAFGTPDLVIAGLAPLLLMVAVALLVVFAWRIARPATPAQAAGAADSRAGLHDELKSAHWFAQHLGREAPIELLLRRAAQTAQRLDTRHLFPLRAPRSMVAALALAVVTGGLGWFSPRVALPGLQETGPASGSGQASAPGRGDSVTRAPHAPASQLVQSKAKDEDGASLWAQLEQLTRQLPAGKNQDALKRAVGARDARLAAQLLQALERNRVVGLAQEPAGRARAELRTAAETQRLLDALQGVKRDPNALPPERPIQAEISPTVRTATRLLAQAQEERRKITGQPAQGDVTLNNRLRAVSRYGAGMRQVSFGEGEAAEAGSRASVSGAAKGERAGKSQTGGSEGESPNTTRAGPSDDSPLLGEPTERLAAQLDRMKIERDDDPQRRDTEEEFYAATQRQASHVEYGQVATQWRLQREAALPAGGTPLRYREAVRQYFLSQHAKEDLSQHAKEE